MNQRARFLFPSLLTFLLVVPGLALGQNKPTRNYTYTVKSVPLKEGEKQGYKLKLAQPYAFSIDTLKKCMRSLAYQERKVSWSRRKRVFRDAVVKKIAPLIMEAFLRADSNSRILYKIKNPRGKTFLEGDTFLTSKGLHWRITTVNHSKRPVDDFSIMGNSWRLVPLKGQAYKKKRPHPNMVQDITNWIVFQKIRPNPKKILQAPKPSVKTHEQPVKRDIKERLKLLDELKKDGLIDREEYESQRRKILNSL